LVIEAEIGMNIRRVGRAHPTSPAHIWQQGPV